MKPILNLATSLFLILSSGTFACAKSEKYSDAQILSIHQSFLKEAIGLTKHCVGFSPPVSGRAFAYLTLGMYESSVEFIPEMRSFSNQMNGFVRSEVKGTNKCNRALVALSCDYELMQYLYRNMPPRNEKELNSLYDSLYQIYSVGSSEKLRAKSLQIGRSIAQDILTWAKEDGGDEGFNANFPDSYTPPECTECWVKTTPGYLPSLLPYWGKTRWLMPKSEETMVGCEVLPFETDSSSLLYQDALGLLNNSRDKNPEFEVIAEYWDDSPGYSGTPSGHFFSLACCLVEQKNLDLRKAIELYAKLGIAMNEAYIASWRMKYSFNFIRPITYIQRYIHPQFNTRLSTPPFPEFPSGHSYQSSAGGEVFKYIFGDQTSFIDSTNVHRDDINGTPRSFTSFTQLVEEVSWSRYYGGIHFRKTLDISMEYGAKLGIYVAQNLKCEE